jgi:hypothetical protein
MLNDAIGYATDLTRAGYSYYDVQRRISDKYPSLYADEVERVLQAAHAKANPAPTLTVKLVTKVEGFRVGDAGEVREIKPHVLTLIKRLSTCGEVVAAIKFVRAEYELDLRTAKHLVDAIRAAS